MAKNGNDGDYMAACWGVAILITTFLTVGAPPDGDARPAEIAEWYANNDTELQVAAMLAGLGVIGITWWFASLWRYMQRAEDGSPRLAVAAAIGMILSASMAMIGFALSSAVAERIDDLSSETTTLAFAAFNKTLAMSTFGDAIAILAVSALAIRTRFLPTWLAYGGAALVVVQLAGALGVATDNAAIAIVGVVAFLSWLAWIATVSLVLVERKTETPHELDLRESGRSDTTETEPAGA